MADGGKPGWWFASLRGMMDSGRTEIRKESKMKSKMFLVLLCGISLAACQNPITDLKLSNESVSAVPETFLTENGISFSQGEYTLEEDIGLSEEAVKQWYESSSSGQGRGNLAYNWWTGGYYKWTDSEKVDLTFRFVSNMQTYYLSDYSVRMAFREAAYAWQAVSGVRFIEKPASDTSTRIIVQVNNSISAVAMADFPHQLTTSRVQLNTYQSYYYNYYKMKAVFMHELGHTLGLAHEHQRQEAIDAGTNYNQSLFGVPFKEYDPASIMHYSTVLAASNNTNAVLSTGDKATIRWFYDGLIFWAQMENEKTQAGPHMNLGAGPGSVQWTAPGKFGQSATLNGKPGLVVPADRLAEVTLDPERGTVEFWFKQTAVPKAYEYGLYRFVNGPWSSYGSEGEWWNNVGLFAMDPAYLSAPWITAVVSFDTYPFTAGVQALQLTYNPLPNSRAGYGWDYTYDGSAPLNNAWHHVAVVWDRAGISGSAETARLYFNGIQVAQSSATNWGRTVRGVLDICSGQDWGFAGKMSMDNLKIYKVAKTNFGDRFIE